MQQKMPAKEECNKATSQEHPFKLRIFDVIFIQNQQRESKKNLLVMMINNNDSYQKSLLYQ